MRERQIITLQKVLPQDQIRTVMGSCVYRIFFWCLKDHQKSVLMHLIMYADAFAGQTEYQLGMSQ